jgi:GntR family transcriptional regulator
VIDAEITNEVMLDPHRSVPLYEQLANELRRRIAAGHYPPGTCVPSEHELAAHYGLGRPTVRQATEQLVQERLLERRRGSGTYVVEPRPQVDLLSAAGTLASLSRTRLAVDSHIITPPTLRSRSTTERGRKGSSERAYHLVRLSAVAGVPVLLEEMLFDAEVFPGLDRHPLENRSLSQLAREFYLLRAQVAEQSFTVETLGALRARRLGLRRGTPVLKVERTIDFQSARGAVYAELYCRTDQVRFTQRLDVNDALSRTEV